MSEAVYEFGGAKDTLRPVRASTVLDGLLGDLKAATDRGTLDVPVPDRPGWVARVDCNITADERNLWLKVSGDQAKTPAEAEFVFSTLILAAKTTDLLHDGSSPTEDGLPVTFQSLALQEQLGLSGTDGQRARAAVRAVFGDHAVERAAGQVMRRSGWLGGEPDPTTPTGL